MKATSMCIIIIMYMYINTSIVFIHFTCTCICDNYICPSMVKLSDRFITSV